MSSANFAPYQPSPDERQRALLATTSATSGSSPTPITANAPSRSSVPHVIESAQNQAAIDGRPSFDADHDPRYATESYQSSTPYSVSSVPQKSYASAPQQPAWATSSSSSSSAPTQSRPQPGFGGRPDHLSYSTAHGWNLSNLCFAAWSIPPFSSVLMLILETENDLVRFHGYQSGLFGVSMVILLSILRALFGWYTISIIVGMGALGYSWVCGSNAANAAPTLARSPFLPALGPLAEQWVGEE